MGYDPFGFDFDRWQAVQKQNQEMRDQLEKDSERLAAILLKDKLEIGTQICVPSCVGKECGHDGCGGSCGDCPPGQVCTPGGHCLPEADLALAPYIDVFYSPKIQDALHVPLGGIGGSGQYIDYGQYAPPTEEEVGQLKAFLAALVENGEATGDVLEVPDEHPILGTVAFIEYRDKGWLSWDESRHLWLANLAVSLYLEVQSAFGWSILDDCFDDDSRKMLLGFNVALWSSPPAIEGATRLAYESSAWKLWYRQQVQPMCFSPQQYFPYGLGLGWSAVGSFSTAGLSSDKKLNAADIGNTNAYVFGGEYACFEVDLVSGKVHHELWHCGILPGKPCGSANPEHWEDPSYDVLCLGAATFGECHAMQTQYGTVSVYTLLQAAGKDLFTFAPQGYYNWNPVASRMKVCRMIRSGLGGNSSPQEAVDFVLKFLAEHYVHVGTAPFVDVATGHAMKQKALLQYALKEAGLQQQWEETVCPGEYLLGNEGFCAALRETIPTMLFPLQDDGSFPDGWGSFEPGWNGLESGGVTVPVHIPYDGCRMGSTLGAFFLASLSIPAGVFRFGVFGGQEPYYDGRKGEGGLLVFDRVIEHFDDVAARRVASRCLGAPISLLHEFRAAMECDWVEDSPHGVPQVGFHLKEVPGQPGQFGPVSMGFWPTRYPEFRYAGDINALEAWIESGGEEGIAYASASTREDSWKELWHLFHCHTLIEVRGPWGPGIVVPPLQSSLPEELSPRLAYLKQMLETSTPFLSPMQFWTTLPASSECDSAFLPLPQQDPAAPFGWSL